MAAVSVVPLESPVRRLFLPGRFPLPILALSLPLFHSHFPPPSQSIHPPPPSSVHFPSAHSNTPSTTQFSNLQLTFPSRPTLTEKKSSSLPFHRLRSGASSSTNRRHFCTFIDKFYSWADFSRSRLCAQTNGKGCNGRRSPGFWHHPPRFPLSDCIQKGPNTHSILRQHNSTDRSYCPRSPFPSLCTLSYQSSFPAKLNQRPLDLRCRCQRPYRAVAVARNNPRPSGLLACLRATVDHRRQQPPQRLHRTSPQ